MTGPRLVAGDPHDEALRHEVHPPDWVNPVPKDRYHVVVIGAGTAGLVTAAAAAGLGAKVALIERHLMGGDCLNVGCVPSKAILSAARSWRTAATSAAQFGGPPTTGLGDFAAAMARMRRLRAGLAPIDGAARFASLGVDVFLGEGRFASPSTIQVGDAQLRFRRAVIATGARPSVPAIPGLAEAGFHTNETIFTVTECPARMVVIGGGPIGCEVAQAFRRLGAEVTLLTREQRILARDDGKASTILTSRLTSEGVAIVAGATIERVEQKGTGSTVRLRSGASVDADLILVATGRTPNVEGLGLEAAGVAFDEQGVQVDDRLRTSNKAVYAAGDVCSRWRFTHAADFQARIVVQNALFFGRAKASALVIPWCTYTDPEVAQVGLTETGAAEAGQAVDTVEIDFEHLDRAVLEGVTDGFLKVLLARDSDRIVGATVVAPHAGDLISEISVAMTNRVGLNALGKTVHPYPTYAEVFRKAADQWRRRKLTPTARALFRRWFAVFR